MKANKLPSGKWRCRALEKTVDGKRYYKSFTADTKKEAERLAHIFEEQKKFNELPENITVGEAIDRYIEKKRLVLSEGTIYGYEKIRRNGFKKLMDIYVGRLNHDMLVDAVNEEILTGLSAKTVINNYGLVRPAIKDVAPGLNVKVTLPRKKKKIVVLPEPEEIINAVKGTRCELAVLMSMWLSYSLSELKGLKRSSIHGDYIQVDQVVIYAGRKIEKELAKVDTRTRKHRLPSYIKELIDALPPEQEYLIPQTGQTINKWLKQALEDKNLTVITLHKCRHLFASITLTKLGINSEVVKDEGGWSTDHTMRSVYTHSFSSEREAADKVISDYFNKILNNENEALSYENFIKALSLPDNSEVKNLYQAYLNTVSSSCTHSCTHLVSKVAI